MCAILHPLLEATDVPAAAINAVAQWWTGRLRNRLYHDRRGNELPGPIWQDEEVSEGQFAAFTNALHSGIAVLIERRTPRGFDGLSTTWPHRGSVVYKVYMDKFDPVPVVASALEAAGLGRDVLLGYIGDVHLGA